MTPLAPAADPRFAEIESHRPYLVRYATAQLRDAALAEEVVQEALVAALEGIAGFGGRSSLRTWLTSILRFKVVDFQRRTIAERARQVQAPEGDESDEGWLDELFDETGHWREPPAAWGDPEAAFEQGRFWETFEGCLGGLSPLAQRVFFKREVLGEETDAICKDEDITSSNCWVILHRARLALRGCLEKRWFGKDASHGG